MAHVQKVLLPSGKVRWRARWADASGAVRSKNFDTQTAAKAHLRTAEAGGGGSSTMTVEQLARAHYTHFDGLVKKGLREAITRDGYSTALEVHLKPAGIAKTRLCDLTTPIAQDFLDTLLTTASAHTVMKVRRSFVTWCEHGQRKGWLINNPAKPCKVEKTDRPDEGEEQVIIPPKEQLSALLLAAQDSPRDLVVVRLLMFAGPRISELLGLPDDMAVLGGKGGKLKIRERLDTKYVKLGPVKSEKGRRDIPLGQSAGLALKAWRLARGPARQFMHTNGRGETKRVSGRLFPDPKGGDLWAYQDFIRECWRPMMKRAGLLDTIRDLRGTPRPVAAFTPHELRHVAVSLWIAQGLTPKRVQLLAGHSTLQMTMDLYGHLWTDEAGDDALAQASERLISATTT